MSVTRYQPWQLLDQLQSEMNRLFESRMTDRLGGDETRVATADWVPAVDIKEEANRYLILADVPGVDPKEIEITMERGVLSIRGQRKTDYETAAKTYRRAERPHGVFYRSFNLPDTADADRITARGVNGVLEVLIPKKEQVQPRKITVTD